MSYQPRHYTTRLMWGVAERLANAHTILGLPAPLAVFDPRLQPYPKGVRGVYFDHSPTGADAETQLTCVITPYLPQSGDLQVEHTRVQLRARHPGLGALQVRDWLDDVRALFPDKTPMEIGGLLFDRVRITGSTSWGEPSATDALETTQNLTFRGNRYD